MQNNFTPKHTKPQSKSWRRAVYFVGVMHADERNRAMSEALGEDVYHYHLHVVYIP